MGFWQQMAQGYNVFYAVSLGVVMFFILFQAIGFSLENLLDLDLDLDGDADADIDVDADVDVDVDADVDGHPGIGVLGSVFLFFYVHSVPTILIILSLFLSFGLLGLWFNQLAIAHLGWAGNTLLATLPATFVAAVLLTKGLTWTIATFFPLKRDYGTSARDLVGNTARVISGKVDQSFGKAVVADAEGHELIVHCRLEPGSPPVPQQQQITLVSYDRKKRFYLCRPLDGAVS